jgi:hypothetical protein
MTLGGNLPKSRRERAAAAAPAAPAAEVKAPRGRKSAPAIAAETSACPKCGRVNPGGKECRVPSACKRRVKKAAAAAVKPAAPAEAAPTVN